MENIYWAPTMFLWDFPSGASGKNKQTKNTYQFRRCKRSGFSSWVRKNPLEEKMETHSSILAWRIPWTQELGGLQSMGSQSIRYDWSDLASTHCSWHWVLMEYIILKSKQAMSPSSMSLYFEWREAQNNQDMWWKWATSVLEKNTAGMKFRELSEWGAISSCSIVKEC